MYLTIGSYDEGIKGIWIVDYVSHQNVVEQIMVGDDEDELRPLFSWFWDPIC